MRVKAIERDSRLCSAWNDYLLSLKSFESYPSLNNLLLVSECANTYEHTLKVFRPTNRDIDTALAEEIN